MTGYEQDLIYKVIPKLTRAIEGLTEELKRYNDRKESKEEDIYCPSCGENITEFKK